MALRSIRAAAERWPLRTAFSISRYTFVESLVTTVEIQDEAGYGGRGECEPHEWDYAAAERTLTDARVLDTESSPEWLRDLSRENINLRLPRGPLRNAVDCALWDLDAKARGVRAHHLAGVSADPVRVLPTIGIDAPITMEAAARACASATWIKIKLGAADGLDEQRLEAVAGAAPAASLLVDANGGWSPAAMQRMLPLARRLGVRIIEQPVAPGLDEHIPEPPGELRFCADESCLDRASLPAVRRHYQYINIKLDKTGGLTEALALRSEAERAGLGVMIGMMSGTSLAVAPASVLAQGIEVVDLELGFLIRDRDPAMEIREFMLQPPDSRLWG